MRITELDEIFMGHGKQMMTIGLLRDKIQTFEEARHNLTMLRRSCQLKVTMIISDDEIDVHDTYTAIFGRGDVYYTLQSVFLAQAQKAREEILMFAPNITIVEVT